LNLDEMSLDELKQLHKNVQKAIASYEARRIAEARKAIEKVVRELGVSLDEVVGAGSGKRATKASAKYRHPENPALTWTGRGRRPQWFTDAVNAGKKPEDLAVS
jgi:DNA-binding protein H-NS